MIVDLRDTTVEDVSKTLLALREEVGAMALSRVLTLVIVTDADHLEEVHTVSRGATHMHPSRIIVLVPSRQRGPARLHSQLRVGGEAGASEVVVLKMAGELSEHAGSVVLPLLLPDSPVVAWWSHDAPDDPANDPIGALAQRRITDAEHTPNPSQTLHKRAAHYVDGDTDMVWTRTTRWRGLLAAALDQPPYAQVESVTVTGGLDSASADLLAAWLGEYLDCPVVRARTPHGTGLISARMHRHDGDIDLVRPDGLMATLSVPGQPVRRLALARRGDAECLSDELTRLDADEVFERVVTRGLARLTTVLSATEATERGDAPSLQDARALSRKLARRTTGRTSAAMVERPQPTDETSDDAVQAAVETQLRNEHRSAAPSPAEPPEAADDADPGAPAGTAKRPATRKRGGS